MVCDNNNNCSAASSAGNFIIQFYPVSLVRLPNGGETINQSLNGNYSINFNVTDNNSDYLFANLYYSGTAGARTNLIVRHINLSSYCSDSDSTTVTTNNCSYTWNTSTIYGTFFLDV